MFIDDSIVRSVMYIAPIDLPPIAILSISTSPLIAPASWSPSLAKGAAAIYHFA